MDVSLSDSEKIRYDRQIRIQNWGLEKQIKLKKSKVAVIGVGGLGSPISIYLAAAGVGKIILVDSEKFELSNLNRQIIASTCDLNRFKAEAAAEKLKKLNPEINVVYNTALLDENNINGIIGGCDVIVDALDNWGTRFLLNRFCVSKNIPLVHGGVTGWGGQTFTVLPRRGPCLECVFKGVGEVEGGFPVVGVTPGIIGLIEALEVIKLLTGLGKPLYDKMLVFDGLETSFEYVDIKRNLKCEVCGEG
ncbi:MAG: HesA/MoeB/ThiF family protein [Candidatus Odinarchaeum yellowstonii]|uniref:HesA/MoeB/ThiF family protein n=1 Tax=Odinarchaeota yellowstonii (strain LCB_4) TaxID=1841599 RepID=A0AAF0D3I6_ODILC|nr:MAG: HesA/MoeB/ThiF family protein [Candidatus Odinarchaeum yellowstonii]